MRKFHKQPAGVLNPWDFDAEVGDTARYNVLTWDSCSRQYSEQDGLSVPSVGVPWRGMLAALRELRRKFGYTCHRVRSPDGRHCDNDSAVSVERTDDGRVDVWFDAVVRRATVKK